MPFCTNLIFDFFVGDCRIYVSSDGFSEEYTKHYLTREGEKQLSATSFNSVKKKPQPNQTKPKNNPPKKQKTKQKTTTNKQTTTTNKQKANKQANKQPP